MFNKKGVSAVIATILLILLTVAGIAILFQFIIPFVKNSLDKSSECLDYNDHFTFDEEFKLNCRQEEGQYVLSIRAKQGNESEINQAIASVAVVFENLSNQEIKQVMIPGDVLGYGGEEVRIPYTGEVKSYRYDSEEIYNKASVRAILVSGRTCDQSDEIKIIEC